MKLKKILDTKLIYLLTLACALVLIACGNIDNLTYLSKDLTMEEQASLDTANHKFDRALNSGKYDSIMLADGFWLNDSTGDTIWAIDAIETPISSSSEAEAKPSSSSVAASSSDQAVSSSSVNSTTIAITTKSSKKDFKNGEYIVEVNIDWGETKPSSAKLSCDIPENCHYDQEEKGPRDCEIAVTITGGTSATITKDEATMNVPVESFSAQFSVTGLAEKDVYSCLIRN